MKQKLFLDTNIVIDFLARREEFQSAANILQLGMENKVDLYITGLTVANITYILRSQLGKDKVKDVLYSLCSFIHIAPITENETSKAFETENPDLEDAIQYYSAVSVSADYIITRDPKHFKFSAIPVVNGREYLNK
ncbi:MAG: PIN domain-containing protein [Bacteroidales bacterium]|nr:PIN domain-containing protein [Bacteroidales bacterium]